MGTGVGEFTSIIGVLIKIFVIFLLSIVLNLTRKILKKQTKGYTNVSQKACSICGKNHFSILKTYKHFTFVCLECGTVEHIKKTKYALEYLIPRTFAKIVLPHKAFLRLFSDRGEFKADDFYNNTSFDSTSEVAWRKSEVSQVDDQLKLIILSVRGNVYWILAGDPAMLVNIFQPKVLV